MNINKQTIHITPLERDPEQGINQWVYQSLRRAVMCGQIVPGLPLTIRGLAKELAVSPMPVREALHRLTCEGAIETRDNRRVLVPYMTAARFKELCNVRIVLETYAAETALPYCRPDHIRELEHLDRFIEKAHQRNDVEGGSLANQAFHRYLYRLNPFQVSVPLIESIWLQLGPFVRIALNKLKQNYYIDRHQEAIHALRQQNAFALRRAIEADIRDGIASIESVEGLEKHFMERIV
ncbi:MAG: GntR family transcriptional regulator [Proteobacteria bacterium]|nr:MAG: GntR family transcriptional regulator [Pseudomonadota bacterium]